MDALKFRKRPLFRQQAVDHFTGVYGYGRMPELLHPGWRRGLRALQAALAVCAVLWIAAALAAGPHDTGTRPAGIDRLHD